GVRALEPELRDLSARLHKLHHTMKTASDQAAKSLGFVCQHALTTTVSPLVVQTLTADGRSSVRVRSGNQDECLMLLISKEVDFAIMYALPDEDTAEVSTAFEAVTLGADRLIPVATANTRARITGPDLPTINYPAEVFLGQVFARKIAPRLPPNTTIVTVAETALTLAMLQLVLTDIGIAWLPQSLTRDALNHGTLVPLEGALPAQSLSIKIVRVSEIQTEYAEQVWSDLIQHLHLAV
ncbi:MAG: LysR substrate-binding domain-containing protein, partial [Paracoccaceae bacterium]